MAPYTKPIEAAFSEKPNLKASIHEAISNQPDLGGLFGSISEYVIELRNQFAAMGAEERTMKKRKLNGDNDANGTSSNGTEAESMNPTWSSATPIEATFSVPQRRKRLLQISSDTSGGIRALNPETKETEFGLSWRNIEHVLCLPVPGRAQPTYNFCVLPQLLGVPEESPIYDPMVWTVPQFKARGVEGATPNLRQEMIEAVKAAKRNVLEPDAAEFVSEVQQPNRKGDKAYHVSSFLGGKDGFLFFLPSGIVWVFKKPLLFFSFDIISSVSYTNVLQRTFNLNLKTQYSSTPQTQEFEFWMIDQADFAGIDAYIKRHRLQDASMAEERRAKKLNINGAKGEPEAEGGEESELQKAAREAEVREGEEDDEDEEDDENFDPGSEGESEGSGASDEEEEDEEGDTRGEGEVSDEEEMERELPYVMPE